MKTLQEANKKLSQDIEKEHTPQTKVALMRKQLYLAEELLSLGNIEETIKIKLEAAHTLFDLSISLDAKNVEQSKIKFVHYVEYSNILHAVFDHYMDENYKNDSKTIEAIILMDTIMLTYKSVRSEMGLEILNTEQLASDFFNKAVLHRTMLKAALQKESLKQDEAITQLNQSNEACINSLKHYHLLHRNASYDKAVFNEIAIILEKNLYTISKNLLAPNNTPSWEVKNCPKEDQLDPLKTRERGKWYKLISHHLNNEQLGNLVLLDPRECQIKFDTSILADFKTRCKSIKPPLTASQLKQIGLTSNLLRRSTPRFKPTTNLSINKQEDFSCAPPRKRYRAFPIKKRAYESQPATNVSTNKRRKINTLPPKKRYKAIPINKIAHHSAPDELKAGAPSGVKRKNDSEEVTPKSDTTKLDNNSRVTKRSRAKEGIPTTPTTIPCRFFNKAIDINSPVLGETSEKESPLSNTFLIR